MAEENGRGYLTEDVYLVTGLKRTGEESFHKHAVLREGKVADAIAAERKSAGKSVVYLSLALICEQIVSLGDLPRDAITPGLLAELTDEDFERIEQARECLKKKARWSRPEPTGSISRSSSL